MKVGFTLLVLLLSSMGGHMLGGTVLDPAGKTVGWRCRSHSK